MSRIDRETTQRIIDTADIVDVISDFVTLKRRGANFWGICPFHKDRSPSMSVNKAKGIYKCFACGAGGSAVKFVMEHEKMSYTESLKYLAKKYGIEVHERELTSAEVEAENRRIALFAVNEFASHFFCSNLKDTPDGRDIALSYLRHRGINEAMIERFQLGYSPDQRDALLRQAKAKGYDEDRLVETGLCVKTDEGHIYDRFRGRVIFPVMTLSGKVVAFGGRTMRSDKSVAKYVNSVESAIYSKRNELYGLYQAKKAISATDKCLLVEGYMDVISMSQSGIENVVASSGTALTVEQIRLIKRFTKNVTLIYDADPAGIKASLRGIDMLLREGMQIRVLQLPEGEDPDSFARSHSSSEVEEYIAAHEEDFMRFKTRILLDSAANDPLERANVITDIVKSIAEIPDEITRQVYIQECSRLMSIEEKVLTLRVARFQQEGQLRQRQAAQIEEQRGKLAIEQKKAEARKVVPALSPGEEEEARKRKKLRPFELQVLRYALKYGAVSYAIDCDENDSSVDQTVIGAISNDMKQDEVAFTNPDIDATMSRALELMAEEWPPEKARIATAVEKEALTILEQGRHEIADKGGDMDGIERAEQELDKRVYAFRQHRLTEESATFLARTMINDPDDTVRTLTTRLVIDRYELSKIHSRFSPVETELDRLIDLVPRALGELKNAILGLQIADIKKEIVAASERGDNAKVASLLSEAKDLEALRKDFARFLGDRIIMPRH